MEPGSSLRKVLNNFSPYEIHNNAHLACVLIIVISLLDHCISSCMVKKKKQSTTARILRPSVNEYDLAKCLGVIFMIFDHRAYFKTGTVLGENLSSNQLAWCRVIGRGTAPLFFWIAGYSNSFRFRWPTFFFAILMMAAVEHLKLNLTYTPFETVVEILALNTIFKYWPSTTMTGVVDKYWFHIFAFALAHLTRGYVKKWVKMQYANYVVMIAFSGLLSARKSRFARFWIVGSMIVFWRSAVEFGRTWNQKVGCTAILAAEMVWMCLFKNREVKLPLFFGRIVHEMSRNAIFYYVLHLCFFRMMELNQISSFWSI